ncbi:MAG: DUF5808 domain-containing protein [Clostridiales Family XIII bacterium]|jgi:uncharacterized membrane protein|nr:DUF5808 domain-containing protein [Clostridiales Family XIII bacterium]
MTFTLLIFSLTDLLLILSFAFTPYVTRKTELFGVSLPASESDRPELRKMRASYRNTALLIGAIMLASQVMLMMLFNSESKQVISYLVLIFGFIIVYFALYLVFHGKMKAFKKAQNWNKAGSGGDEPVLIVDTEPAAKESFSPIWLLLYPVIAAATGVALKLLWPSLPDKLPMHMDLAGKVDRWADKDFGTVIELLWPQWLILLVFAGVFYAIRVSKRQIDAANPETSREQGRKFRRVMSGAMLFGGAFMGVFIGAISIFTIKAGSSKATFVLPLALMAIIVVLVIILYIRIGQGGSRLKNKGAKSKSLAGANPDDDKYWKLGQFYFNKSDPAVWIEQRFGIGWTLNYARPLSWFFVAIIIAIIVAPLIIFT